MDQGSKDRHAYTRRDVLKGAPLLVAAGAVLGALSGKTMLSLLGRRRRPPLVRKGSIFTPADDERERA